MPAKMLKVEIVESRPTPNSPFQYTPVVEYQYRYQNKNYLGTLIKRVDGPSSDKGRAEKLNHTLKMKQLIVGLILKPRT